MPEGHSIHRLALAFAELFGDQQLSLTSPQGRFAAGAALLDNQYLVATDAHGKQLFLGFHPEPWGGTVPVLARGDDGGQRLEEIQWLRIHLGLYGSWTFDGDSTFVAPHAIGAPRRRVAEEERAINGAQHPAPPPAAWQVPAPRGAVRARLLGAHGVADLTGPAACEVIDDSEKTAHHERLGPDPLRMDGEAAAFVAAVRRSRRTIGELLMEQSIVAGAGNIYRAEVLYRAGVNPWRLGRNVPPAKLRAMWADLELLMSEGVASGAIITTEPQDRTAENERCYVYHRSSRPCLRCGSIITEALMANRRVFWCPREQRRPPRRA